MPEDPSIVTAALQAAIQSAADKGNEASATILVSLAVDPIEEDAIEILEGRPDGTVVLNGQEVTQDNLRTSAQSENARLLERSAAREQQRALIIDELSRREGWDLTDDQKSEWASDWHLIPIEMKLSDVNRFAEANRDLILSVDLPGERSTSAGLLNGERDTFIEDTLGHSCSTSDINNELCGAHRVGNDGNGYGISVYLTEVYCPASLPGPGAYTKLAGTCPQDFFGTWADCRHVINTTNIVRAVAQRASVYCRGAGLDSAGNNNDPPPPSSSDRSGANPPITITSESFNYISGAYGAVDQEWDDASYSDKLFVVNSAGNGAANNIGAPSHGFNVLTVGNYDDATHTIASTSRYLNGTDNATSDKPEVSAPGQSIDAGIDPFDSTTITLSGTSMAAAFTAGFAADLQGAYAQLLFRPALMKAWLLDAAMGGQTGTSPPIGIAGGFDKVGWGGINYKYAYYKSYADGKGYHWAWDVTAVAGLTAAFTSVDAGDGSTDGNITVTYPIDPSTTSRVNVALAWLNRGTYTLSSITNTYPITLDLDVSVVDPLGNNLGTSASVRRGWEVLFFYPTVNGTYTFKVHNSGVRDANAKSLRAALDLKFL